MDVHCWDLDVANHTFGHAERGLGGSGSHLGNLMSSGGVIEVDLFVGRRRCSMTREGVFEPFSENMGLSE